MRVRKARAVSNRKQAMRFSVGIAAFIACLQASAVVRAETPQEWIELGARVHGGFGAFIPLGIRIAVVYYDSERALCACVADGIAIATIASVGQRTLEIAHEKAPAGMMAVAVIRSKQTGASIKYTVADSWLSKLSEWNRMLDPRGRYDAVMNGEGLFEAVPMK